MKGKIYMFDVIVLNQWEQGKVITNPNMTKGDLVIFRSASGAVYIMSADDNGVEVPNALLMDTRSFVVDLEGHPEQRTKFKVTAQDKPDGYIVKDNVPDICGIGFEDLDVNLKEMITSGSGGSGGVSSWNDLTDKPFDYAETGGDTIHWNAYNTSGLLEVRDSDTHGYYKVSDATPTVEDFANGCYTTSWWGTYFAPAENAIRKNQDGTLVCDGFIVVPRDNCDVDPYDEGVITFPEKGLWIGCGEDPTTSIWTIQIPGYTGFPNIKRMDATYMPLLRDGRGGLWSISVDSGGMVTACPFYIPPEEEEEC